MCSKRLESVPKSEAVCARVIKAGVTKSVSRSVFQQQVCGQEDLLALQSSGIVHVLQMTRQRH